MLRMEDQGIRQKFRKGFTESSLLLNNFVEQLSRQRVKGAHGTTTFGIGEVSESTAFSSGWQIEPSPLIGAQTSFGSAPALGRFGLAAGVVIKDAAAGIAGDQLRI